MEQSKKYEVDTEKFREWLSRKILEGIRKETSYVGKADYNSAAECRANNELLEFILECIETGPGEFMKDAKNDREE